MNNDVRWKYIDTKKATKKAIEDYKKMKKLELILGSNLNEVDEVEKFRIEQKNEFLHWFEPAWESISQEEQLILKEFYMGENLKSGAGIKLQFKIPYSERQLHRLKDRAVADLSVLLFGK